MSETGNRAMLRAPVLAFALVLAACGGKTDAPGAGDAGKPAGATGDIGPSGPANSSAGAQSGGSQPAQVSPASLDTSGWLLQPPFYAAGDEPYWRLDIIDGWFVFKRSGLPEIEAPMVQPKRVGGADVFDASPLAISIARKACETDEGGKGDVSAVVTFDDAEYTGCAFGGQAGGASADAEQVVKSVKAVDACLEKLGEAALVTGVYPREGGRTALGMRTKNGSLYECAAESSGEIAFLDPIEPGASREWMTRMRFLRDGVSPETQCADAEEVRTGDKVVGRLLTPKCRF